MPIYSTAEVDFGVLCILPLGKCPSLVVLVVRVLVIPQYPPLFKTCGTCRTTLIDAVPSFRPARRYKCIVLMKPFILLVKTDFLLSVGEMSVKAKVKAISKDKV